MNGRRAYFSAADRSPAAGGSATNQQTTATTRQQLAADVIAKAEHVASAVKTLRAFDVTGHALDAMPHLQTAVDDLRTSFAALAADVAKYIARGADPALDPAKIAACLKANLITDEEAEILLADRDAQLEASIRRHPAGTALADPRDKLLGRNIPAAEHVEALQASFNGGSALAAVDAAEADAAGEPPLPAPLGAAFVADKQPTFSPKPAPGPFRKLKDRPQA